MRRADSEARTKLKPCSLAAEEEAELPRCALGGVRAVDQVVRQGEGEVAPDGAWRGLGRVRGAHKVPHNLYGALTPYPHRDDGGRCDELDELVEERLVAVLCVVLLGEVAAHVHKLHRVDVQALGLDAADDLTDEAAADAVPLH